MPENCVAGGQRSLPAIQTYVIPVFRNQRLFRAGQSLLCFSSVVLHHQGNTTINIVTVLYTIYTYSLEVLLPVGKGHHFRYMFIHNHQYICTCKNKTITCTPPTTLASII